MIRMPLCLQIAIGVWVGGLGCLRIEVEPVGYFALKLLSVNLPSGLSLYIAVTSTTNKIIFDRDKDQAS